MSVGQTEPLLEVLSDLKKWGGQQEEGNGVVHHVQWEHQYFNHTLGLTLSTPDILSLIWLSDWEDDAYFDHNEYIVCPL